MSSYFLAPIFFAFLATIPIVILLYLLKLRRTQVVVSSTMLWFKSLQDLTANAPFQRLRRNLLLLLQILILLALVIALARPYVQAEGGRGRHLCVLIDNSASMMTVEDGASRLETAKERALDMVDDMRGGDRMMIVSFAESTKVRSELTEDKFRLREAIRSIQPTPTATRIRDAVLVARSLKASTPETQIIPDLRVVIISDGKIADLEELGARAFDVDFLQIGETTDNAGIVAFSVREPNEQQAGERQCFVLIHNEAETELQTTLTLSFNGNDVALEEVIVPPRDEAELVFAIGDLAEGVLEARLDYEDALAVDNTAWLALRPTATIQTLLVAEGNSSSAYFLKRVLMLEPRVELSSVSPDDYYDGSGHDLVIFDGHSPETLPDATMLFVNAAPPLEDVALGEVVERPGIIATDSEHPMMRFLNPSTVSIAKARRLEVPADARALVSTDGGPLVADVSRQGKQMVVVAFDLADSNWPWHLSFPLFMQNLLAWSPRSALTDETFVQAGRPLTILPNANVDTAVVTTPDGVEHEVELNATRPAFFGETEQVGVYQVALGEETAEYAVNLLNALESSVAPAEAIQIGRAEVEAETGNVKQNKELWRWFVVAALAVLAIEWWIYARRAWL